MKILLVTTPSNPQSIGLDNFFLIEPLALEYIGAGIQDHHDVKLLDLRVNTEPGLKETLETFQPDVIGCGACTADVFTVKQMFAEAKKISPGILTVIGGHHATVMPGDFFDKNIDVIVIGEGVEPFKKICQYHEKKMNFQDIESIYYRKDEEMVFTREKPFPDLDSLPFPARALTSHIRSRYCYPLASGIVSLASIRGAAGCVYNCNFCAIKSIMKRKVHRRSIPGIIEELASIKEQIIFWTDDEFLIEPGRAMTIAREIKQAQIKKYHYFYGRADNIVKKPGCIEEWAKIGLLAVMIGLESHRENDLKMMRKGTSLSKNQEAIRICHANRVQVRGNFIIHPDFDRKDFKRISAYSRFLEVDAPSFSILTPYPGTELYEEVKQNIITDNYNLFDISHTVLPTRLPLKQFYKEYRRVISKGTSLKHKFNALRYMEPHARRELFSILRRYNRRLKESYLDHVS